MSAANGRRIEGVVANLPLFRQCSRAQLAEVARHAQVQLMHRGMQVCRRGEHLPGLYAVAYGQVKLALRGNDGTERVVRLVGPGETFGEAVVFLDRACPVDAVALCDAMIVLLPTAPLIALIERDSHFARAMIASLSSRMHALVADVEAGALHSGLQRVAAYLESLAETPADQDRIRLPATKTVIAARLGITKETFSRLLRDLVQQGLIAVAKREIVLLDRERLAAIAQGRIAKPALRSAA